MHTNAALQSNCKTQSCGELAAEPILHPDNVTGIDLVDQNATPVAGCGYFGETLVDGFLCEIELRQGYLNHTLAVDLVRKNGSRLSRSSRNSRRAFKILPSSNARVARAASPTRPSSSVSASRPLAATAVNH